MKTFDEALQLIMRVDSKKTFKADMAEMGIELEKRAGICQEIQNHSTCEAMVQAVVHTMSDQIEEISCQEMTQIALALFINGVLVGMEMERQTEPHIALD